MHADRHPGTRPWTLRTGLTLSYAGVLALFCIASGVAYYREQIDTCIADLLNEPA